MVSGFSSVKIDPRTDMAHGDPSFTYHVSFINHCGTHLDAPRHFSLRGRAISEFEIADFVFEEPLAVDIPKGDSQLVFPEDFKATESAILRCDLLLIRTGFEKFRQADSIRYRSKNPGFSLKAAVYLFENFPRLRAIGMDVISLAAMEKVEEGIKAHVALLDHPARPFFIIEDMYLNLDLSRLKRVIALPLMLAEADSGPCTILGEMEG